MARRTPPPTVGRSGTRLVNGRVTGVETNPDLRDERWPLVANTMMREDDAVQAGGEAVISTLLSARMSVSPGDPSSAFSRKLAGDCAAMLGTGSEPGMMARSLRDIIAEQAMHELFGFRYGEARWGFRPGFGVTLEDIEDRDPTAHHRWITDAGRLVAVEQHWVGEDGYRHQDRRLWIPADNLLVVVRGKTGANWNGRGLLRGCYAPWQRKRHYEDMAAIAAERWAVGVPELRQNPREATEAGFSDAEHAVNLSIAREALDSFSAQEQHWVESAPGIELRRLGGDLDVGDILTLLQYEKSAILTALLLGFLQLGQTETGSRSVGTVLETFFRRAAAQAQDRMCGAWNGRARPGGGVLHRWCEFNHGPVDPRLAPKLSHAGLVPHPLMDLVKELDLADVLSTRTDRVVRNTIRAQLALDPEPEPVAPMPAVAPTAAPEPEDLDATPEPPEPDLPTVRPGDYSSGNRDVADLLGMSTTRINGLVRRSLAVGIEVPAIGSARDRRWELARVLGWYQLLTGSP